MNSNKFIEKKDLNIKNLYPLSLVKIFPDVYP